MLSVAHITKFNIADRLAFMVESLVQAIVGVFQPVFYKKVVNNSCNNDVEKTLYMIISINCYVSGIFFTSLSIMVDDFILLWVGDKYVDSGELVQILIFAYLARVISRPITGLLIARAQHKTVSYINF